MTVQFDRLRQDLGLTEVLADDTYLQSVYVRVEEEYPSGGLAAEAQARIYVIYHLIAQAAKRPDYVANETNIEMSQIRNALMDLLAIWKTNLAAAKSDAATSAAGFMHFVGTKKYKEKPQGYPGSRKRFF